jgi:ADP-ribosylglycohydrolase
LIGAIAGDIIGSVYEHHNIKVVDFPLFNPGCKFTDDTVLTVAIADAILSGSGYAGKLREYYRLYPERGYGPGFLRWAAAGRSTPYNSHGNGSAMRVSSIGSAFSTLEEVLRESKRSAEVTHNHHEGIKGAQAVASAIFLARTGTLKEDIKAYIRKTFEYDLSEPIASIRSHYRFDVTCAGSVPQAITAFLESEGYEDAIRKAISIGGDSDTIACIAGAIAEAFYRGIPQNIADFALSKLDDTLRNVITAFRQAYQGDIA